MKPVFLCINKPRDITSYDCIRVIRKIVGRDVKVGHGGTLDPFATGLMIIAIDRQATKHLDALLGADKRYNVQGLLGQATDTYDITGALVQTCAYEHITKEALQKVLTSLQPGYEQVPPIYSALKSGGKPLYELARTGKASHEALADIAATKARHVKLYELTLTDFNSPYFSLHTHVSTGTYIRSLIYDIGALLGSCGTTSVLERTQIGPFTLADAVKLDDITSLEDIEKYGISVENFLQKLS